MPVTEAAVPADGCAASARSSRLCEIVELARAGSSDSWEKIFALCETEMSQAVGRPLRKVRAARCRIDPEDALQEARMQIFLALKRGQEFPEEAALLHYAAIAARDAARKLLRTHTAARKRSVEQEVHVTSESESVLSKALGPAECAEARDYLEMRVDALADFETRALLLWYLLGYTPSLLARKWGVPVRVIRRRINKVLSRWRHRNAADLCSGDADWRPVTTAGPGSLGGGSVGGWSESTVGCGVVIPGFPLNMEPAAL